jgi:hypothetical protein
MQTFMPYPSCSQSAAVLDDKQLGKQRIEGYQILNILLGKTKKTKTGKVAWENHPAVKMWKGHEKFLCVYVATMCKEWIKRGYKDSLLPKIDSYYKELENVQISSPDIIGNEEFHSSHRAALLYENYEYYKQFQWKETPIGY